MIPETPANADQNQTTGQAESPAEQPAIPPVTPSADMAQASQEASPPTTPTPPQSRIAASLQRMPVAGRWTLGLGLAFLSGFVMIVASFEVGPNSFPIYIFLSLMGALALAAGFVLTRWWTVLALAAVAVTGALAGSWAAAMLAPDTMLQGTGRAGIAFALSVFFALFLLTPLILLMLAGVGIGRLQGMSLGQPRALSAGERQVSRWIGGLAPVVAFGFLAGSSGVLYTFTEQDITLVLYSVGMVLVSSLSCLLAGWVLRSWRGVVVTSSVYVVITAIDVSIGWAMTSAPHNFPAMIAGFVLLVIAPAVVMGAIGAAIGMRAPQRPGTLPQRPQSTLPAT